MKKIYERERETDEFYEKFFILIPIFFFNDFDDEMRDKKKFFTVTFVNILENEAVYYCEWDEIGTACGYWRYYT